MFLFGIIICYYMQNIVGYQDGLYEFSIISLVNKGVQAFWHYWRHLPSIIQKQSMLLKIYQRTLQLFQRFLSIT